MTSVCLRDTTLFCCCCCRCCFFCVFFLQYCTWMWAVWPFALLLSVSHLNSSRLSVAAVLVRLVLTKLIHAHRMFCGSCGKPNVLMPDFWQEVVPHSSMAMVFLCCSPKETPRFALTNVTGRAHYPRPQCPCFFFFFFLSDYLPRVLFQHFTQRSHRTEALKCWNSYSDEEVRVYFERKLNVFLDLEVSWQTLKCRHPRYVLRFACTNGPFRIWCGVAGYLHTLKHLWWNINTV